MKGQIISPAKAIEEDALLLALNNIRSYSASVTLSENANQRYNYFSEKIVKRKADVQEGLNADFDFLWMSRGGYGVVQILGYLNFEPLRTDFKWIIGFSDITYFHSYISTVLNLPSIHGTMPLNFEENTEESLSSVFNVLKGLKNEYSIAPHPKNEAGSAQAIVVGGNLAVLSALTGSKYQLDTKDKILFIEDVGEVLYKIDRMMYTLSMSGQLDNIAGLIVGGMTYMKDTSPGFGSDIASIILNHVSRSIPVCFDFPAGHVDDNRAIVLNHEATLVVSENKVTFHQSNFNYYG